METYCFLFGMSKDKRKGFEEGSTFEYMYGTGEIGDIMDRYGIEGVKMGRPSAGGEQRSREDVNNDIAKAMMNDYDTRRAMEAAALAGDKDAAKFAKKGFKGGSIYSAYDKMKQLKQEYVGGGGMRGPENEAGLTHAIVNADRDSLLAKIAESNPGPADPSKEEKPETSPSLGETEKSTSPYIKDAAVRNQQFTADRVFGKKSSDKYNAQDVDEDNKEYKQADAFNYLSDFKLDLKSKYN